jgi:hypothetical protein
MRVSRGIQAFMLVAALAAGGCQASRSQSQQAAAQASAPASSVPSAAPAATASAPPQNDATFLASFRTSFVQSCEAQSASAALCYCIEASVERDYPPKELVAIVNDRTRAHDVLSKAAKECAGK